MVLVDDRVADHQRLHVPEALERADDGVAGVPRPELAQERLRLLGIDVEVGVQQTRRAEGDLLGEVDAAADCLDRDALVVDLAGQVRRRVRVVAALHVDRRAQRADRLDRGRRVGDGDVIDRHERRHRFGAQALVEHRAPRALVDEPVRGDRDHQDVALAARRLEVADVAGMQQVEDAVAVDDAPAARALPLERLGNLLERL